VCIPPTLDEKSEGFTFIVDGTPKPVAPTVHDHNHFVEMPVIARLWSGSAKVRRDRWT
jgi:hypothetical protein